MNSMMKALVLKITIGKLIEVWVQQARLHAALAMMTDQKVVDSLSIAGAETVKHLTEIFIQSLKRANELSQQGTNPEEAVKVAEKEFFTEAVQTSIADRMEEALEKSLYANN